jgi:hypothetical protein
LFVTFSLERKSNQKVQGKHDRSARFSEPAPPHCLKGIFVLVMYCLANNGVGAALVDSCWVRRVAFGNGKH